MVKRNLYLWQPQYSSFVKNRTTCWIPYSVGCIWSYVSQFADVTDNWHLQELIFRREEPEKVLSRLQDPALCGFSCYVWNHEYCLTLASMIKQRWPKCLIVFGGPQASGKMLAHDFIDSIIVAEGEENFHDLLSDATHARPIKQFYSKKRLENLDIPSPYTSGVFDKIMQENPDVVWHMVFETNRGCPYACTFCDWGGINYSKIKQFSLDRVRQDLEWCIGKPIAFLLCADANFGIFRERDLAIAQIIHDVASQTPSLDGINLQYAKNSTEVVFEIAQLLGPHSRGVTVSVQSMHEPTLEAVKRKNLDVNNLKHIMNLSERYQVRTYTEVILGLPLETIETWKTGLTDILEMGQHSQLDMWFAQLLENGEMSQDASRQLYGIKSIVASDYMPLIDLGDHDDIDEKIELVNCTNTMSTADIVEGYMYGWMIIHFHMSGYSQWLAKYCRHKCAVSYRTFYDRLFSLLPQHRIFKSIYSELHETVSHYLTTGKILSGFSRNGGHVLHAGSYQFMYDNITHAFDIAQSAAESLCEIPASMTELQSTSLYRPGGHYPVEVALPFDIYSWQDKECRYRIEAKISSTQSFDFYRSRRLNLIKNHIINIDQQRTLHANHDINTR